jgi:hypothetical protein
MINAAPPDLSTAGGGRNVIEVAQSGLLMLAAVAALAGAISMVRESDAAGRGALGDRSQRQRSPGR